MTRKESKRRTRETVNETERVTSCSSSFISDPPSFFHFCFLLLLTLFGPLAPADLLPTIPSVCSPSPLSRTPPPISPPLTDPGFQPHADQAAARRSGSYRFCSMLLVNNDETAEALQHTQELLWVRARETFACLKMSLTNLQTVLRCVLFLRGGSQSWACTFLILQPHQLAGESGLTGGTQPAVFPGSPEERLCCCINQCCSSSVLRNRTKIQP